MEHQRMVELMQQIRDIRLEYWLNETLFTFNWWLLLVTTIGAFIVWLIVLDKKRIVEIVTYGFFVTITGLAGDIIGTSLVLWQYPHTLTPIPLATEVHIIQMPIIYMIIYQYFKSWKSFLIASTINAFIFAFILETTLVALNIYEPYHWEHIYSFLPYIIIAVVFKWVVGRLKKLDENYDN